MGTSGRVSGPGGRRQRPHGSSPRRSGGSDLQPSASPSSGGGRGSPAPPCTSAPLPSSPHNKPARGGVSSTPAPKAPAATGRTFCRVTAAPRALSPSPACAAQDGKDAAHVPAPPKAVAWGQGGDASSRGGASGLSHPSHHPERWGIAASGAIPRDDGPAAAAASATSAGGGGLASQPEEAAGDANRSTPMDPATVPTGSTKSDLEEAEGVGVPSGGRWIDMTSAEDWPAELLERIEADCPGAADLDVMPQVRPHLTTSSPGQPPLSTLPRPLLTLFPQLVGVSVVFTPPLLLDLPPAARARPWSAGSLDGSAGRPRGASPRGAGAVGEGGAREGREGEGESEG